MTAVLLMASIGAMIEMAAPANPKLVNWHFPVFL